MKSAVLRGNSQLRMGIGQRFGAAAGAALFASAMVAFTPTAASAFDVQGLIGTAFALGVLQGSPYHHARSHVVSRRDSGGSDTGVERDARDVGTPAIRSETKIAAHHQPYVHSGITTQASERDAAAGEPAPSGRGYDDTPAYRPSR
jgi:hypothetical protein